MLRLPLFPPPLPFPPQSPGIQMHPDSRDRKMYSRFHKFTGGVVIVEYGINILHIQRPQRTQRARIACHGGLRQTSTRKAVRRRARLDTTTIGCPAFKETRGRTKRKAEKQCDYERFLTLLRAAVWQSGRLEAEPNAQQRNSATISYAGPYYEWMLIILSGRWQYRRSSKEEAVQQ